MYEVIGYLFTISEGLNPMENMKKMLLGAVVALVLGQANVIATEAETAEKTEVTEAPAADVVAPEVSAPVEPKVETDVTEESDEDDSDVNDFLDQVQKEEEAK